MALDDWPRGEPSGAELLRRRERILQAVAAGRAEHDWCPLQLADSSGNVLHLRVSCDALKIDGVRVNVDATVQQEVADRLGALLLTPKLVDEIYRRSAKLPPSPQPITASVEGMIAHSGRVDQLARDRQARTPPALANVGKDWVLTKRLFTPENVSARKAANYGWLGTAVSKFPSVTGLPIIQNVGLVHSREHSDYCVAPETLILTADLRWVPASSLTPGEEIIGFDEKLSGQCRYRSASVLRTEIKKLECVEVITDQGSVVSSCDHRWVTKRPKLNKHLAAKRRESRKNRGLVKEGARKWKWMRSSDLEIGATIAMFDRPWKVDESREGGWMSGILDGEGWCSPPTGVGVGQKPGVILEAIINKLKSDGFNLSLSENGSGVVRVMATGSRASIRLLAMYRPKRLLPKARMLWEDTCALVGGRSQKIAQVKSVRHLGEREVVALQTTTKTLICNGFLSHNSQVARFVHRKAIWNEQPVDLADVYTGRAPGTALVSHEGPLPGARMPDAGATPPTPTGPPPSTKTPPGGTPAAPATKGRGLLVVGLVAGAAAGAGVAGPPGALVGGLAGLLFGQAARVA